MILGIDTSCYTTSVALCENGEIIADKRNPLVVPLNRRGLRQSDGVFMHIKALPDIIKELGREVDLTKIKAVAVSDRPRPEENSYMPVFTVGQSIAQSIASALNVPLYKTSHQEGHIMAALVSSEEGLQQNEFVSIHISGGTTEILFTKRNNSGFLFECVGKSLDIHAGQLVDRCGVLMGMRFPCGKELDNIALSAKYEEKLPVTMKGTNFHLSGAETWMQKFIEEKKDYPAIAKGVLLCIARSIENSLKEIHKTIPFESVCIGGGVSASKVIREYFKKSEYKILFARQDMSTDNACGVALIGEKMSSNDK